MQQALLIDSLLSSYACNVQKDMESTQHQIKSGDSFGELVGACEALVQQSRGAMLASETYLSQYGYQPLQSSTIHARQATEQGALSLLISSTAIITMPCNLT